MREQAVQFGISGRLSGVVTVPDQAANTLPAIVLLSVGFAPKAGPYRLYALLARRLTELGFPCLRMDLGGLGDSVDLPPGLSLRDRTMQDIREALDYLADSLDSRRFVLAGLCSGAEDAFQYGLLDDRVVGLSLLEPHHFETPKHKRLLLLYRIYRRLLRASGLFKPLDYSLAVPEELEQQTGFRDFQYTDYETAKHGLQQYLDRGVNIQYIFTGGSIDHYTYRRQVFDMFDLPKMQQLVTADRFSSISHLPVYADDRDKLIVAISGWLGQTFHPSKPEWSESGRD